MFESPSTPSPRDLEIEELNRVGSQVLSWITDYFREIDTTPVYRPIAPDELRRLLAGPPPDKSCSLEEIMEDFKSRIVPYLTHWNHPRFLAYFANTASAPGILAETLSAALNVNAMLWKTAPAASALEEVVLDWMKRLLGFPLQADGVLLNGASLASMWSMRAAMEELNLNIREGGLGHPEVPRLRAYWSDQAHSSLDRAAMTLGIGLANVVRIPCDRHFRLRPELLKSAIEEDLSKGMRPFFVCATSGTTSTAALDPVDEIHEVCRRFGLWLHVDAAYGGAAALLPEMRLEIGDFAKADSLVFNPHKWLLTPMEISVLLCRRVGALRRTFGLVPDYLSSEEETVTNFMDLSPQLGRSFRALKLWFVIRAYGVAAIREFLREQVRLARWFAGQVEADPEFELVTPVSLSVVCFRARATDSDAFNTALLDRINSGGVAFLSHTRLNGHFCLRLAIGNLRTTREDIAKVWMHVWEQAVQLRAGT